MTNKFYIEITDCSQCKCFDNTGSFNSNMQYICNHNEVSERNKVPNIKYWYNYPVIAKYKKKQTGEFPIPDWCPMLKKRITM